MNRRQALIGGGVVVTAGVGATALSLSRSGNMTDYDAAATVSRSELTDQPADFIRMATLAANGHNTQPWLFCVGDNRIEIRPDLTRRTPAVDPDDHHLFVSLGCAAENLAIAAAGGGRSGDVRFDASGDGFIAFDFAAGPAVASPLLSAITRRQSTRSEYTGQQMAPAVLQKLAAAIAVPGVEAIFLTDRLQVEQIVGLTVAGNAMQMSDAAFRRELRQWIRFNPGQAIKTRDGLFSGTNGNPSLPTWLGKAMFDLVFRTDSENAKYAQQLRSSAGVVVFV